MLAKRTEQDPAVASGSPRTPAYLPFGAKKLTTAIVNGPGLALFTPRTCNGTSIDTGEREREREHG